MGKVKKTLLIALGLVFVGIGIIGIFVPGVPRTGPAIAASICFSKTSPRLYNWLMQSKHFGPYLDNYYNKTGLPMAYKIRTVALMWSAMAFSVSMVDSLFVQILVPSIGLAVSAHVFTIRKRLPEADIYSFKYNITTIFLTWIFVGLAAVLSAPVFTLPLLVLGVFGFTVPILVYAFMTRQAEA